jgi:iron complex outermembrane receptor protein
MGVAGFMLGAVIAATPAGSVPAEADAQARSSGATQDPIVVTGERVARTLLETPSSVALYNERDIERASAARVEEVLALVPNLTLGNGSQGPAIRGQDTTGALQALPAFLGGNRPRTTVVVDGRRQTYNEFVFGDAPTWDIDRIEVFRSPQTTTQGQNSIAGAIFVHSNDPVFEAEGRARLIGGNGRLRQASAMVSAPLSPDVAFRVSGDLRYSKAASWIEDVMVGADPNHRVHGQIRAKLLALPKALPGARLTLAYAHTETQSPQIEGVKAPFERRRDDSPGYGIFRTNVDTLTLTARQDITPRLTAALVLSGGDSVARRLAIEGFGQTSNTGRDWSVDATVNWSKPAGVEAVAGISRNRVRLRQTIDLSAFSGLGRFRDVQDGLGVFGQVELPLLARTTLSIGLRYQEDRQRRVGDFDAITTVIPLDYDETFRAWLPKVSVAFAVTDDVRLGAMVQRAYNPGGTTLRFDTGAPDNFDAETLWNYEAFARASLLDGSLTLSGNLFYNDIHDAQRAKSIIILAPIGLGVGFADLFNVPRARAVGGEAELRWRVSGKLEIRAGAGLLGTRITRASPGAPEYAGKQFERSPAFTGIVAADWTPSEALRFSASVRHSDDYWSDDANSRRRRIPAFTVADLRAEWTKGSWSAFAYAQNLFDDFYLTYLFAPEFGTAGDPREIGVGIEARF